MFERGIVAHDPLGELLDGTIVNGMASVIRARDSGVMVLPYDAGAHELDHLGCYARRGWGDGWALSELVGVRTCPMLIRLIPEKPYLYWAAWVSATGPNPSGTVRLVHDSSYAGQQAAVLGAGQDAVVIDHTTVGPAGAIISGKRRVSVAEPGVLALNLYATADDVAVLVSAISQSRIDVAYP